ncbi:MAG: MFS transporter [Clostridia bacterium]|nr:MFS transporter [Clostridia bacterium]
MKLNYKRTLLVGFAFFLICTFWTAYDTIIPKILTDHYGLSQALSGIVMALDNILALFLLPFFGSLSDKTHTRIGKRKPFILAGTLIAVCAFVALTFADSAQLAAVKSVSAIDDPQAMSIIYDNVSEQDVKTPDGADFRLKDKFGSKEAFQAVRSSIQESRISSKDILVTFEDGTEKQVGSAYKTRILTYDGSQFWLRDRETEDDAPIGDVIKVNGVSLSLGELFRSGKGSEDGAMPAFKAVTNTVYTNYVAPARQAYIRSLTTANPTPVIWFMVILMVVLVAMSTFRSPAVALMPDVTVKPLRSKANAIINLMGTLGGMVVLVMGMGFAFNTSAISNTFRSYFAFFVTVAAIMVVSLIVFMATVKEPKWTAEQEKATALLEKDGSEQEETEEGSRKLSKAEARSLLFILASVVLWFFGYNAVTSKYSVYATNVLDLDYSTTLLIANAAAVVSYIPVGIVSSKIGRKKTILAGILMLAAAFFAACFMRVGSPSMLMNVMFALAGIGWATINVNSCPMVVELSRGSSIGKYSGYYYAASMGAQAVTPFLSGLCMDHLGMTSLFPYAVVFVLLSFVTMLFVRHGDAKPIPKDSLLEQLDVGD